MRRPGSIHKSLPSMQSIKTMSRTPENSAWSHIKQPSFNPRCEEWENYGGRGIMMCDEWKNDFSAFLRDVGLRPSPKHSIDRYPNNDGNYEPGNIRWATSKEQNRNKRTNFIVEYQGQRKCIRDWATEFNINSESLRHRLLSGLSMEAALTHKHWKSYSGRRKTHCKRGHPLEAPNIYVQNNGARQCIACLRAHTREYRARDAVKPLPRTHCRNGHLLAEANVSLYKRPDDGCIERRCKQCGLNRSRKHRMKSNIVNTIGESRP
jgi:hypothetical protein